MSTRRAFLGTLGKMLGAGGVLLPLAGNGALALPGDLGKAAALPVTATPLPVSAEMLRLREIRRELHSIYLATSDDFPNVDHPDEFGSRDGRSKAWRDVMRNKHTPLADAIIGRKKTTWSDCMEIAEIALHQMYRRGPRDRNDPLCALVWAVLSAGGIDEVYIPELGGFSLEKGQTWWAELPPCSRRSPSPRWRPSRLPCAAGSLSTADTLPRLRTRRSRRSPRLGS